MSLADRPPSSNWEAIPFADSPAHFIWVWFKPEHLPDGLIARVPDDVFAGYPHRGTLSARRLLQMIGVDPATVATWTVHGMPYESHFGQSPLLDYPLPDPVPNADPNIAVRVLPQPMGVNPVAAMPLPVAAAGDGGDFLAAYERIEADWQIIRQLESQLATVRKQVTNLQNRLNALNRDLSPEERLNADRKDRSDWQVARRWLRDLSTRLAKVVKDQDIGDMSNAGRRQQFEEIIERHVVPKLPMDNVTQWQREFETHRKMVQSLLMTMSGALSQARQDGEQRADQILKKISASVRGSRSRR